MPCHRINKLVTHAHHRDRSAAVGIFSNGISILDNPRVCVCVCVCVCIYIYDFYESACKLVWCHYGVDWKNIWWCVFFICLPWAVHVLTAWQTVAWNDASCVVSPVLPMFRTITSVVMTCKHAVLHRFALWVILLDEAYGDTVAWWTLYSTQLREWLNTSLGHTEDTTMC